MEKGIPVGGNLRIITTVVFTSLFTIHSLDASIRMPVFSTELLKTASVANLFGQNFIFKNEDSDEAKNRPIWILAGDSLSSGWANKDSLVTLYSTARQRPLLRAGSALDLLQHFPSSLTSWFAGSSFNYGVFGYLNPEWAQNPNSDEVQPDWVLVATAYAGAVLMPEFSRNPDAKDPVQLVEEVQNPERAKLVTMSIGANDTCQGIDSFRYQNQIETKLRGMRNHFRRNQMEFAIWNVPAVDKIYTKIMKVLNALPEKSVAERNAKSRLINYCQDAWQRFCPSIFSNPSAAHKSRDNLNRLYKKHFGNTFEAGIDQMVDFSNEQVLYMLSSDCFHPSNFGHKWISDRMIRHLKAKNVSFR